MKTESSSFLRIHQSDSVESPAEPKLYKGYCFLKMKNNFYDLNPLDSIIPYQLKGYNGQAIHFNFCSNVDTSCINNQAMVVSKDRCKRFSYIAEQEKTWTLQDFSKKNSVLTVTLPEGDVCERKIDRIIKYTTSFEITCDKDVKDIIITNEKEFDPKKCHNLIKIKSKYGIE